MCARLRPVTAEQLVGPVALADIEPERAGGVGHVLDVLAGQQQADIGLGQQHLGDLVVDLGLVLAHPGDLGRGEAGHGDVAGDARAGTAAPLPSRAHSAAERPSFQRMQGRSTSSSLPSSVAPCMWPERPMPRTAAISAGCDFAELVDGLERRVPPVGGVLLGPAGMRAHRLDGLGRRFAQAPCRARSISSALTPDVPISMPR